MAAVSRNSFKPHIPPNCRGIVPDRLGWFLKSMFSTTVIVDKAAGNVPAYVRALQAVLVCAGREEASGGPSRTHKVLALEAERRHVPAGVARDMRPQAHVDVRV